MVLMHFPVLVQILIVLSSEPEIIIPSEERERARTASLWPERVAYREPD